MRAYSTHVVIYVFHQFMLYESYIVDALRFIVGISQPATMPKDSVPSKRKATDKPAPLYDNSTRGFISTRTTTASTFTASNVASRQYTVKSQIIPGLPRPLFGHFDEALYRPPDWEDYDNPGDMMDVDNGDTSSGVHSGLPGITIKTKLQRSKRYTNSVRLSFLSIGVYTV